MVEILYCTETANYIQFMAHRCQKYTLHQKSLQFYQNSIGPIRIFLIFFYLSIYQNSIGPIIIFLIFFLSIYMILTKIIHYTKRKWLSGEMDCSIKKWSRNIISFISIGSIWVVLQKLLQLSDTYFSQVLNKLGKKFFSWFYKISSRSPLHLNYTSFPLSKQQQHGF